MNVTLTTQTTVFLYEFRRHCGIVKDSFHRQTIRVRRLVDDAFVANILTEAASQHNQQYLQTTPLINRSDK